MQDLVITDQAARQRGLARLYDLNTMLHKKLVPAMRFLTKLMKPLNWLHERWQYMRPVLFPAMVVVAVVVGFTIEQGRDVLVATAAGAPQSGDLFEPQPWLLAASLMIFSLTIWYFARLALDSAGHEVKDGQTSRVVKTLPGLLGMAPLLASAIVFYVNREAPGCWYLVMVCVALIIVVPVVAWTIRNIRDPGHHVGAIMPTIVTTGLVALGILVVIIVSLPGEWNRVWVPGSMGTATIVLIAGSAWVAFGTGVLVQPTLRLRLIPPLLLLFLSSSLLWNYIGWNDNHTLSRAPEKPVADGIANRQTPSDHFTGWLNKRVPPGSSIETPYPAVVVAAEGGGIRAAYWTALVLTALEDRHPGFFCHVYAISGVSGGSLGAVVFNALVTERIAQGRGAVGCDKRADMTPVPDDQSSWNCDREAGHLCSQAQTVLGRDFLAPTTAGMLFPDLVQRFLPIGFLPDRQSYLEQAWEAAWDEEVGDTGRMADDFLALWSKPDDKHIVPALLLNATEVARGGRSIVSSLQIADSSAQPGKNLGGFVDAQDALGIIDKPIRLSTAAGLSARFSYVSPAANTGKEDANGRSIRYVDGGYFENSGTLTALELMQASGLLKQAEDRDRPIRPIVLAITNSSVEELDDGSWLEVLLSEMLPPLDSLLHARIARGEHATRELANIMESKGSEVIRADLPPLKANGSDANSARKDCREKSKVVNAVPLSWMLADDVKRYVDCMAKPQIQEVESNLDRLFNKPVR